jgi:hypothetical protein
MTILRRLLCALATALLACWVAPQMATAASTAGGPVAVYDYNHPAPSRWSIDAAQERGPPAAYDRLTTLDAVDRWSNGVSARSGTDSSPTAYAYNDLAHLVQVAHTAAATPEQARDDDGALSALVQSDVAAKTGGAASVRLGQAGEAAVRGAYDIGPKASAQIGGRTRIFDGLIDAAVSEVENVGSQSLALQLRGSLSYAQSTGRRFDLYVRQDTYLSGPLRDAIGRGDIALRFIP